MILKLNSQAAAGLILAPGHTAHNRGSSSSKTPVPEEKAERSPTPALRSFYFFTRYGSGLPRSLFAESQQTVEWLRQGRDGDIEWGEIKTRGPSPEEVSIHPPLSSYKILNLTVDLVSVLRYWQGEGYRLYQPPCRTASRG
jgi:hypothetical protein